MSLGKKVIAGTIVALVLLFTVVAGGLFFVAPSVAHKLVRDRLDRAEQKLGLNLETRSVETAGLGGVEITGLTVVDGETGRTIATVQRVGARLDLIRLLGGQKVISAIWTEDVDVTITREADGSFDILNVLKRARADTAETEAEASEESDGGSRMLRLFGGTIPELDVTDVTVAFAAAEGAPYFPVRSLAIPTGEIEHRDGIEAKTRVSVESNEADGWSIPTEVDIALVMSDELAPETMTVKFDRPLEVSGLGPYPFLRVGFDGVEIAPEQRITVTDAHAGFASMDEDFLNTTRVTVQLARWVLDPSELSILEVAVDSPRLTLEYDTHGASALTDLNHAVRAPRARQIAASARAFAADMADDDDPDEDVEPVAEEELDEPPPAKVDDEKKKGHIAKLIERLPQRLLVTSGTVDVLDHRDLPVARPARTLRLEEGSIELVHRPIQGNFRVETQFAALADEQPRGSVEALLAFGYRNKKLDADITIDALDLSWLGQLLGPAVAEHIRGGTLRGKVGVKPQKGRAVQIDGNVSVENLVFFWDLLTEEPITRATASYGFSALYDPAASVPEPRLLKRGMFKESNKPPPGDPVYKGALVFDKGAAQLGGVKADIVPAIYGTDALPRRLPARIDLKIDLPRTPVQDIFEAVPAALKGPLQGIEMTGSFAWKLDLELPPYRAGAMEWVSTPVLEDFELVNIPADIDPQKLMTGFDLTITDTLKDKNGEEYEWSRTVRIPKAKPVPARWIVENGGLALSRLDARRRKREWPPAPDPHRSYLPRVTIESPEYWYTAHAESQVAPRPWGANETIRRTEERPYGPYVFVPLHHISPWVVKTVTTTEDGGFFTHPGFLFDAIKESVEDNIEASRFRRGASTISMQLVKNAFLDRQKLIARKLREAFLVWLMEDVVDIPKSRILEVYLNIIEFGPGIYGIHEASLHYFGKRPNDLTAAEVSWLFSILASPKRYHFYWRRGEITERWWHRMKQRMKAMVRRDKMTEAEYEAACRTIPKFYKPTDGQPVLRPTLSNFRVPLLLDDSDDDSAKTKSAPKNRLFGR